MHSQNVVDQQIPLADRVSFRTKEQLALSTGCKKLRSGLLASLRTERSDATNGAPGLTTRNKKLLGATSFQVLVLAGIGFGSDVLQGCIDPLFYGGQYESMLTSNAT